MSQPEKCPFCGSRKIFPAQIIDTDGGRIGLTALRFPAIKKFPWWKFASAGNDDAFRYVSFDDPTACLGCGMPWAKYELAKTRQLVERHGSAEMKAALATPDDSGKSQAGSQ